jgi:hypothetical protein
MVAGLYGSISFCASMSWCGTSFLRDISVAIVITSIGYLCVEGVVFVCSEGREAVRVVWTYTSGSCV